VLFRSLWILFTAIFAILKVIFINFV